MIKATLIAIACTLTASVGLADEWNKKTIVTLREPMQVPGTILEPGTYVFKLVDSLSNRNIVQITNEDGDKVYTTFIAIPNYRLEPTDKTSIQLYERPVGHPVALRAWFYPGDNFGQEIAYPKEVAVVLARESERTVLETRARTDVELRTESVESVDKSGVEKEVEPVVVAEPVAKAEPEPAPVAAPEPKPAEIPETATPFAAIAFFALAAVVAGLALRSVAAAARHA